MPIPKTRNVGSTIKFLHREKPEMPQRQKVAIGLNIAREAGANIPKKPGNPFAEEVSARARTRRFGKPKTEMERKRKHRVRFGTSALPPRGTGLLREKFA